MYSGYRLINKFSSVNILTKIPAIAAASKIIFSTEMCDNVPADIKYKIEA